MVERLEALTVREHNGKSYWSKLGVAWPNKTGPGFIVRLDAIPASVEGQYVIHLREPLPKDGRGERKQSYDGGQQSDGQWGGDSDPAPF